MDVPQIPLGNRDHESRHDIASKGWAGRFARIVCTPDGHEVLLTKVSNENDVQTADYILLLAFSLVSFFRRCVLPRLPKSASSATWTPYEIKLAVYFLTFDGDRIRLGKPLDAIPPANDRADNTKVRCRDSIGSHGNLLDRRPLG